MYAFDQGLVVGLLFPECAKDLVWLGDAFVALITMMILLVIFCTLVLGVGSARRAALTGLRAAIGRCPGSGRRSPAS